MRSASVSPQSTSVRPGCSGRPQAGVPMTGTPSANARSRWRGWCTTHVGSTTAAASYRKSAGAGREKFASSSTGPQRGSGRSIPGRVSRSSRAPLRPSVEAGKTMALPRAAEARACGISYATASHLAPASRPMCVCGVIHLRASASASVSAATSSAGAQKSASVWLSGCPAAASFRVRCR